MSQMIRLRAGSYGRVAILRLNHYLVEHAHADNHLQFWLDGSNNPVAVDGHATPFDRHSAVAINSWQPHASPKYESGEHTTFLLLYLRTDWLSDICLRVGRPMGFPKASFEMTMDIEQAAGKLCRRLLEYRDGHDEEIGPLVKTLVIRSLLKVHAGQPSIVESVDTDFVDPRVSRAVQIMNQNLGARMSLEEVAALSGVSRPHFFALFRKSLNVSPTVYWNTLRMEKAILRLARTEISMGDLAHQLGFSEPANFSRFFKLHTGVCPSLYRSAVTH